MCTNRRNENIFLIKILYENIEKNYEEWMNKTVATEKQDWLTDI